MKLEQSHSPPENSSRFRQLVKSYWHSIVDLGASATSTDISRESSVAEAKIGEDYKFDPSLTNDIVNFVCNSEVTDVESLRRAINCQVKIEFFKMFFVTQADKTCQFTYRLHGQIFV